MKFSTSALLAVVAFAAKANADICGPQEPIISMKGMANGFGWCAAALDNIILASDAALLFTPNSHVAFTNGFNNNDITVNAPDFGCDTGDGEPFDMQLSGDVTITHEDVLTDAEKTAYADAGCTVEICTTVYTWGQGQGNVLTELRVDGNVETFELTDGDSLGNLGCAANSGVCTREDTFCVDKTNTADVLLDNDVGITVDTNFDSDFYSIDYSTVTLKLTCPACQSETAPDPHFKTFSGDWFDFHGQCDLVLIDVPDYDNETGLSVNIRTTVRYAYSFIETVAIQVGEDILQVSGWGDYMINGISNVDMESATLNGRPVRREIISDKQSKFVVDLENGHHFTIKVFKDMISTSFDLPEEHDVRGILGDRKGAKLARDGITIIEDANEFGQEWQVQDTDHQLFQTVRAPQFPAQCIMPDPVEREKRRLAATVSQDAAEAACSHVKDEHVRDMCIFDVMSVDDLSLAAGAY